MNNWNAESEIDLKGKLSIIIIWNSYHIMQFVFLIETERPKKLGVFINPIGGSQNSLNVYSKTIAPLFRAANIVCDVMGKHAEF